MISRLLSGLALTAAAMLAGCTRGEDPLRTSAYTVNLSTGAATEIDHPGFDPELGGYWIVGAESTIQFSRVHDRDAPEKFCFMLRTKADASASHPSELDLLKIVSARYLIVTKFKAGTPAPVDILTPKSDVLVKSDTSGRYVKLERIGAHIKVTLSKECLTQLIDPDAAITWSDKRTDAKRRAAEAESWRRVL